MCQLTISILYAPSLSLTASLLSRSSPRSRGHRHSHENRLCYPEYVAKIKIIHALFAGLFGVAELLQVAKDRNGIVVLLQFKPGVTRLQPPRPICDVRHQWVSSSAVGRWLRPRINFAVTHVIGSSCSVWILCGYDDMRL